MMNEEAIKWLIILFIYIPIGVFGLFVLSATYWRWLMGDVLTHKMKVLQTTRKWKKKLK